jgi:uncharacterized YccA/Bax inhibitor family protein
VANALLEKTLDREAQREDRPGWAAPTTTPAPETQPDNRGAGPAIITDRMTIGGVASATGVLFVILLATGGIGWSMVDPAPPGETQLPGWLLPVVLVAAVFAIVASLKPTTARYLGPLYAAAEGLVLGAISRAFENEWDGIVLQAVALTVIVFGAMLFLYSTRIIRVTDRMRRVIVGATIGIAIFYGISLLVSLFGAEVPLVWDAGPFGILFSFFVAGIAAFNLALDFDIAERGVQAGLPKYMEWFVAVALMVSIVWLYLEILRLLAKLRER